MESISNSVGIDVHKASLQVSIHQSKPFKAPNDRPGIEEMLLRIPEGATIHIEASGGYERLLRQILQEKGIACKLHNPRKIERLADALGRPAKTDDLDAVHLCQAGPLVKGHADKSPQQEELCDFSRTVQSLKQTRTVLKKKMAKPGLASACVQSYQKSIATLDREIKKLEKAFLLTLGKSYAKERYELALSVACVGPISAATIVSELPANLYTATPAQLTAYASIAPKDDSSGKRNGPRHIQPGNMHLKQVLYMPAITAISSQVWAKDLYHRLRARGRTHQQAIVAVMRKLLLRVIAVIQRGTPYEAVAPKNLQVQNEP